MAANNWIPIGTSSGSATDYSFTSIPSGEYKGFILRGSLQASSSVFTNEFYLRCNNDTGSNYADADFGYLANTTSVRSNMVDSVSGGTGGFTGGSYLGNWQAVVEIHIFGVSDTNRYTTWVGTSAMGGGANGYNINMFAGGIWKNTANVTQLDTFVLSPDTNSTFTLYGRK